MSKILRQIIDRSDFSEGKSWHKVKFSTGKPILLEDEDSRDIYLIIDGSVRANKRIELENDRKIQSGFADLGPGDIFGELNLFDKSPRSVSVIAQKNTTLIQIEGSALLTFLDSNPELGYQLFRELFQYLATLLRKSNNRVGGLFAWGLKQHGIEEHL